MQKALPKNVEKTNLNLRNPQDSRFLNKNFNYNNQMVNNRTSYECRNSSQLTTNEYSSGTGNYHSTNFNNLKNTYGYYNLQEELDNIMISNTNQDLNLIQLETRMASAEGSTTTLGAGLLLTSGGTLLALDLVNQKFGNYFFKNL